MSRVATTFLNLGTWREDENAGAGSQTIDNNFLNGNWIKIDTALGTGHNADGSHKAGVIIGTNLASSVVDDSSLEYYSTSHYIRVKALGIIHSLLGLAAVQRDNLHANTVSYGLTQDANGAHIPDVDGTTVKINDSTHKIYVDETALNLVEKLFSQHDVAETAAGNVPTTTIWQESSSTYVHKIYVRFTKRSWHKYIKLSASCYAAGYSWYARVTVKTADGITLSWSGNEAYGTNTSMYGVSGVGGNCASTLDISTLTDDVTYLAIVELKNTHNGTISYLSDVNIALTTK
jgi:hypothetical protein